ARRALAVVLELGVEPQVFVVQHRQLRLRRGERVRAGGGSSAAGIGRRGIDASLVLCRVAPAGMRTALTERWPHRLPIHCRPAASRMPRATLVTSDIASA